MESSVVVIGGGPAGLTAAAELRKLGHAVTLVEKEAYLGGTPVKEKFSLLFPELRPAGEVLKSLIDGVQQGGKVKVMTKSQVVKVDGTAGNFTITVQNGVSTEEIKAGAVIVATGYDHFDPEVKPEYGYRVFPDVITSAELEEMLHPEGHTGGKLVRPSTGATPKKVAIVQCVGSRDSQVGHKNCCRVGCTVASKQAVEIREKYPDTEVYIFYMDIRTYGRGFEELYWKAQDEYGVRYVRGRGAEIRNKNGQLVMKSEETMKARAMEVPFDLIVLTVGFEAGQGTEAVAKLFNLPLGEDGFLEPVDRMINPVESPVKGIFIAGAATGPKDIEDAVLEGATAAVRAVSALKGGLG